MILKNVVANKREKDNIKLFNKFRSKVLKNSKMSKLWSENYELAADIVVSLFQMVDEHPRVGWVRGGENVEELLAQINRLRIENDKLARSNEELKDLLQDKKRADNLAQDEDIINVTGIRYDNKDEYDPEFDLSVTIRINQKKRSCSLTWNALLQTVAPICFTGCKEYEFRNAINELCQEKIHEGNYEISQKSFDVIKFQMLALNWISIEKSLNDIESDSICLTNEGKKEFMDKVTIKKHFQ